MILIMLIVALMIYALFGRHEETLKAGGAKAAALGIAVTEAMPDVAPQAPVAAPKPALLDRRRALLLGGRHALLIAKGSYDAVTAIAKMLSKYNYTDIVVMKDVPASVDTPLYPNAANMETQISTLCAKGGHMFLCLVGTTIDHVPKVEYGKLVIHTADCDNVFALPHSWLQKSRAGPVYSANVAQPHADAVHFGMSYQSLICGALAMYGIDVSIAKVFECMAKQHQVMAVHTGDLVDIATESLL